MLDARTIGFLSDSRRYGEIRLYGALSFGLLVLMTGWLIDQSNDDSNNDNDDDYSNTNSNNSNDNNNYNSSEQGGVFITGFKYVFYLHLLLSLLTGILVIFYPIFACDSTSSRSSIWNESSSEGRTQDMHRNYAHINMDEGEERKGEQDKENDNSNKFMLTTTIHDNNERDCNSKTTKGKGVLEVMRSMTAEHPDVIYFIAIVFLSGVGDGVIDAFLFLRLKELGGSGKVIDIYTCI